VDFAGRRLQTREKGRLEQVGLRVLTEHDQERFHKMIGLLGKMQAASEERAEEAHQFGELCAELRTILIDAFPLSHLHDIGQERTALQIVPSRSEKDV
jgi:hypothetical protein